MPQLIIEAVVATSTPLPVYGGVRIGDAVLLKMAEALRSGQIPMVFQHDIRRPLNAKVLQAAVRPMASGYKEVWVQFEVDAEQWEEYERERVAAGAPGGFSFSCSEPLTVLDPLPSGPGDLITLAADASHWTDEELLAAAEDLRSIGTVRVERRFEFAHIAAAVVVVSLAISVGVNVFSDALYDGLKRFLLPRRNAGNEFLPSPRPPTIFHFRVERPEGVVEARLETDDPVALRRAIDAFDQLVDPGHLEVWDSALQRWRPL